MLCVSERAIGLVLILSLFLLPDIPSFTGMPNARFEDIIVLFLFMYFARINFFVKFPNVVTSTYFCLLLMFCIWILVTIIANNRVTVIGDYFELYKLLKYSIVVYLFSRLPRIIESNKSIFKVAGFIFFMMLAFNLANLTNLFGFNDAVLTYFAPMHHIEAMKSDESGTRLLGTIGNPNNNAVLWSWLVATFLALLLTHIRYRMTVLGLLFSSVMMCLLTQSRTTLIGLIFGYFILFIVTMERKRLAGPILMTVIAGCLGYFLLNQFNFGYIRSLWELDLTENMSWLARLKIWEFLYDMIQKSFWFGYGPNKNFFYDNNLFSENEYILMIWRYGIFGLIFYLAWLGFPWILACKIARDTKVVFAKVVVMMAPLVLVVAVMNSPMTEPRLMLIYAAISGLMLAEYQAIQNLSKRVSSAESVVSGKA